MTDINTVQGLNLQSLGLNSPNQIEKEKSEKDDFLKLFVAQLRNQNPLEPQDGSDFLGQLAQFSTVEGIKNMESAFSKIADSLNSTQALQATSLVGKKVQVRTDAGIYEGEKITGAIEVPAGVHELSLHVKDSSGQLIKSYQLNPREKGDVSFTWDGLDSNGDAVPNGVYRFEAQGNIAGKNSSFDTFVASNVDSVTINKNGQAMTLNVSGFGKVSMNDIKTIS